MERDESYARIHEALAGTPLAAEFARIEQHAEAYLMIGESDLTDYESEVLSGIEEHAGVLWRCHAVPPAGSRGIRGSNDDDECEALNWYGDERCYDCGAQRDREAEAEQANDPKSQS